MNSVCEAPASLPLLKSFSPGSPDRNVSREPGPALTRLKTPIVFSLPAVSRDAKQSRARHAKLALSHAKAAAKPQVHAAVEREHELAVFWQQWELIFNLL